MLGLFSPSAAADSSPEQDLKGLLRFCEGKLRRLPPPQPLAEDARRAAVPAPVRDGDMATHLWLHRGLLRVCFRKGYNTPIY